MAISSQSRPRDCETNGRTEKLRVSNDRAGDWCEDHRQVGRGGANNHFRLGGACVRELTPWVSRGHGNLRRGAPGKGKSCGAEWVLVRSYSVRRPCSPFVVDLSFRSRCTRMGPRLHSGPQCAVPNLLSRSSAVGVVARQTQAPGPCALLGIVLCLVRAFLFSSPGPSTHSVPGTRGSLLFSEGRRELGRV